MNYIVTKLTTIYRIRAIISCGLYIFISFSCAVYNQERLILQTISVVNKENVGQESAVYNQERFQIKTGYNGAHTVVPLWGKGQNQESSLFQQDQ